MSNSNYTSEKLILWYKLSIVNVLPDTVAAENTLSDWLADVCSFLHGDTCSVDLAKNVMKIMKILNYEQNDIALG